jgi:hypothetical protein
VVGPPQKAPDAYFGGGPHRRVLLQTRAGRVSPALHRAGSPSARTMNVGVDDILAALIMTLIMMRRLETLSVKESNNPGVAPEDLAKWRRMALAGYNLGAIACFAKVTLNIGWFWLWRTSANPWVLRIGGAAIFIAWVVALVIAWQRTTEARILRQQLGIHSR